ncbi:hypothetical protein DV453_002862 [Geotrichum candidum]|nr:hypothetical protein DV453_002862 [Geotrichum candidum]
MKFSTALFALSSAIGAFAVNSFTTPIGNETLTAGETFIIRWNNTNGGDTVDLFLKKGNASNLETALTISTGLKNVGAVRWFLPEDLYTGSDYALQITNKDDTNDINYSPFFTIVGKDPVTTTSTTSSSSTKKTSTKHSTTTSAEASTTEASSTEASSTAEASASAAPNSTVSSTLAASSSFVNSTASATGTRSSAASGSATRSATGSAAASGSGSATGSASGSAAASGTTTAAGSNGASALSLNNAVVAVGLAGAAFFAL